jgi:hypothetical protein
MWSHHLVETGNPFSSAMRGEVGEEDELLQALVFSGTSVAGIAKRLKRSRAAVYSRASRLKIFLAKSRRVKAKGK